MARSLFSDVKNCSGEDSSAITPSSIKIILSATARETFNSIALSEKNAVEKAALFIFLNKTCFNGLYRVNRKGHFNVPMGAYKNPCICDEDNLRNVSKALQNVEIVCGDYSLSKRVIDENTFVYLDPPYRPISETSAFTSYNADVFDDNEQIRLARFIDEVNATGAKVVLYVEKDKWIVTYGFEF